MKFLVLCASGMKGHVVALCLKEKGYIVDAYSEEQLFDFNTIIGSFEDIHLLNEIILNGNYDAVINLYSIINQYADEDKVNAIYANSYLPQMLSRITENCETKIIHISTDCIYSGSKGSYTESDLADGTSYYARTKALGELKDSKNITLRNSVIGPDMDPNGIGLLNWFMKQAGTITGFSEAIWSGITSMELANIIEEAINQGVHGLFNMCPNKAIDKYNLLLLFNKYFKNNSLIILSDNKFKSDKSLLRTNYDLNYEVPDYEKMVQEMAEWVKNHKDLYPHYNV